MERYDIAIIGTGPAGLEAALTAKARNKHIILFGSAGSSEKVRKAHSIANYLGLANISGEDMQKAFISQIEAAGISITDEKVTLIYPMGDYFSIQSSGDIYEATTVILAAGMAPAKTYPGENEYLGRGVSYCATCDAALYKGKTTAIIASSPEEEVEVDFMTEYAAKVYYFPLYKEEPHVKAEVEVIREKPVSIEGTMKVQKLVTDAGEYETDGVFILRESVSPGQLVPGLQMDGNHVQVERNMATNVAGCFAAGDITGAPYQYIKAAGEGNVAALSAVSYIDMLKRKA